jgi:protoheme IX farnesyltransferase
MSDAPLHSTVDSQAGFATPGDFVALLKPRVMSLVVFTALVGMVVAPGAKQPVLAFASLLAIAVGAGASGALNMWWDADIDAVMTRTARRPIPAGRVAPQEALAFGLILSAFSVLTLALAANWAAAGLLAFTIFYYAVVYTMWLKRSTPQNIVIGGAAGAFPPMIGYAAITGGASWESLSLFALIFIWTPPHFWALALVKSDDYARAGVPMMPNAYGPNRTRREILAYAAALAPAGLLPWWTGVGSGLYGGAAALGGLGMIALALDVYRKREGRAATVAAWRLFGWSIVYLFGLFATLLVERLPWMAWWERLA